MRAGEGGGPFEKGPPPSPAPPSPFPKLFNVAETGGRKKRTTPREERFPRVGCRFSLEGFTASPSAAVPELGAEKAGRVRRAGRLRLAGQAGRTAGRGRKKHRHSRGSAAGEGRAVGSGTGGTRKSAQRGEKSRGRGKRGAPRAGRRAGEATAREAENGVRRCSRRTGGAGRRSRGDRGGIISPGGVRGGAPAAPAVPLPLIINASFCATRRECRVLRGTWRRCGGRF